MNPGLLAAGSRRQPPDLTYLLKEDFTTGIVPVGWSHGGGHLNYADDEAPAPLQGVYSASATISTQAGYGPFPARGEIHGYFMFWCSLISTSCYLCKIKDVTGADIFRLRVVSTGAVRASDAGGTAIGTSSGGLIAAEAVRHIWFHYAKGTGADAVIEVWVADTDTKPGSPQLSINTFSATANAYQFGCFNGANGTKTVWDKIRVKSTAIGSAPE